MQNESKPIGLGQGSPTYGREGILSIMNKKNFSKVITYSETITLCKISDPRTAV